MAKINFRSICEITNAHEKSVNINRIDYGITGDLSTAAVLSRLRYWFSPSKKNGQQRTRIRQEGRNWMAREDEDWQEECCVSAKQIRRVKRELKDLGLVETKVFMFGNKSVTHWWLNVERYAELYNEQLSTMLSTQRNENEPDCEQESCLSDRENPYKYEPQVADSQEGDYEEEIQKNNAECTNGTKRIVPKGQSGLYQRDNPIYTNIRHQAYSSFLDTHTGNVPHVHGVCEVSNVQRALMEKSSDAIFQSEHEALKWMQQIGFTYENAKRIFVKYSVYKLMSAKDYVRIMLDLGKISKSLTGYFLKTLENEWWVPKLEG